VHLLLGDGERRGDLEGVIASMHLGTHAEIMPWLPFSEVPSYIDASDIIVLPYTYPPTSSRSLLEGMAAGKALVTCPVGEIPIILQAETHALFANPEPQALADAMARLASDLGLRERLSSNVRALVQSEFSSHVIAAKTANLLYDIVARD